LSLYTTGDRTKFLSLKEFKGGSVTHRKNYLGRIVGKCTVSLHDRRTKTWNVFFVEGLGHNLLSEIQMVVQDCDFIFHFKVCEMRRVGSRILVDIKRKKKYSMGVISLTSNQKKTNII